MFKVFKYILVLVLITSCASKKYVNKQQLKGNITEISETTYALKDGKRTLLNKKNILLTKNGRIQFSETFDSTNKKIEMVEKKLFFSKKSFPDKESYYCKTRWKPNKRERISCYSQKKYKQNEIIVQYNKDGTIASIKDNFNSFNTYTFNYSNAANSKEILNYIIKNKEGKYVDEVKIICLSKDAAGNCTKLKKNYKEKSEIIERVFKYK